MNCTYTVIGAWEDEEDEEDKEEQGLVLEDEAGVPRNLTWAQLYDAFIYALAHTCHSLQGMSVSDGITLFDLTFWHVTREWFYTALTRATSLDRIFYWEPEVKLHSLQAVQESEVRAALERKIAGHKMADRKAGRSFDEADYVTPERVWELMEEQRGRCFSCGGYVQVA